MDKFQELRSEHKISDYKLLQPGLENSTYKKAHITTTVVLEYMSNFFTIINIR